MPYFGLGHRMMCRGIGVINNAKGEISEFPFREGNDYLQRSLLESEGVGI
jgi:hypothetical protein